MIKSQLYLNFVLARDTLALVGATENVLKYGTIPPDNALSDLQSYYFKHPGFILLAAILRSILGLTEPEHLVLLFFGIFTIILPFSFYTSISEYYNSKVSLLSTFLFVFSSIFLVYDAFSRGSIAVFLMLLIFLLLHHFFSRKSKGSSSILLINIILCTLILTHDFTSAILIIFTLCLIVTEYIYNNYNSTTKLKTQLTMPLMIALIAFFTYDIYYSNLVIKQYLPEVLSVEKTQLSTEVIFKERTLRQLFSLVSRSIFWASAGILFIIHFFTAKKCATKKYDISFTSFAVLVIAISLILGFLPSRLWMYAYICLLPVVVHIMTNTSRCASRTRIKKCENEKNVIIKTIAAIFIASYFASQIAALPPLLVSPYSAPEEEYTTGDFRYQWSKPEIVGIHWIYYNYNATQNINMIGDLATYLIASQYPLRITASITQLKLATEGQLRSENLLIIYRKEMENIMIGRDGFLVPLSPVYRNLDQHYNLIYMNGEVSHYIA
jgi:hypothetical protein